jgi:protein-glutamine gamma-glutamyltransferase
MMYEFNPKHHDAPDRTASFLFGDRRGYCVHLAHAMTMLLRSLDVPARVATGYLVGDARVGPRRAFLVYESDSHAWCEIYVRGAGWTVAEGGWKARIAPQELEPDPREIEHYMATIDDVPRAILEENQADARSLTRTSACALLSALLAAIGSLYALKAWRRWCPRLSSTRQLPRVGYRAVLDRLADAGFHRRAGETWDDFAERLHELAPEFPALTHEHMRHQFAPGARVDRTRWTVLDREFRVRLARYVPARRRWLGALNPISWIGVG